MAGSIAAIASTATTHSDSTDTSHRIVDGHTVAITVAGVTALLVALLALTARTNRGPTARSATSPEQAPSMTAARRPLFGWLAAHLISLTAAEPIPDSTNLPATKSGQYDRFMSAADRLQASRYESRGTEVAQMRADLADTILGLGPHVRYVALASGQDVTARQRENIAKASSTSSDFFEELLVNPTLLTLARQRGELDCGGLRHVVVGYGNFHQVVIPLPGSAGHVSVCVELDADPAETAARVADLLPDELG